MADSLSLKGIGNLGALQAGSISGASKNPAADVGKEIPSFGNVLNKMSDKNPDNTPNNSKVSSGKKERIVSEDSGERKDENVGSKKAEAPETGKVSGKETKDTGEKTVADGKVKEAVEAIKEEIKEELGVSDEDIIAAMETLGLSMADLLKPEIIGELTAVLTDNDISAVVSDEGITLNVQNILKVQREVTGDLMQDLNLTAEEFRNALDNGEFLNLNEEAVPEETFSLETEGTVRERQSQELLQPETVETVTTDEKTAGTPAETVDHSEIKRNTDRQPEREQSVTVEITRETTGDSLTTRAESGQGRDNRNTGNSGDGQNSLFNTEQSFVPTGEVRNDFMDNLTEAVSQTTSEFVNSYERVQDIMNQVRDQVRISVNQETTTMEMQLNPESLGKVGLHIESRAGNITAQFFAQDESVRAALEMQVSELRRSLVEQGIKVENVEVTLASREFDSDFLNGQQGNTDNPTEEEAERTARLRRINLNAAAGEEIPEEELSEEEILNRRIMADNGGTVDFSA